MRCKLLKDDVLCLQRWEPKGLLISSTHHQDLFLPGRAQMVKEETCSSDTLEPRICSLPLSLYFCTLHWVLLKAGRKLVCNRTSTFYFKWWPRILEVKAALVKPFHLVTRSHSSSCWNLGCLWKLNSLPRDMRSLDWPVLLIQLIELSTFLSLGHHQPSNIIKALKAIQEVEHPKGINPLKNESACWTKYSCSNVWL